MKKDEMQQIKDFLAQKNVVSVQDLKFYISQNFKDKNPQNMSFYIFDLKKQNILYQLDKGLLKYAGKRREFKTSETSTMVKIWQEVQKEASSFDICIWQMADLYQFTEQQPFRNYIFVEVEKYACENVFYLLKNKFTNVFYDLKKNDIERYISEKENIIVRPLTLESPINNKRHYLSLGSNRNYRFQSIFPSPKVEKILVDLMSDKTLFIFDYYGELKNIFTNILQNYWVDFAKLKRYARNRNKKDEILNYIENVLRFDIERGEFL